MTALLYTVGTGLLATVLWWVGSRLVRAWQRTRLWRFVLTQRKLLRRLLAARLALSNGRLSRRQAHLLASTFRLRRDSRPGDPRYLEETFDAPRFLAYLEAQGQGSIVLINADTGYGKTILAMTLPLLRTPLSPRSLFPAYVDLAEAEEKNPLAGLEELLCRLSDERRLWGRPLILLDALNETIDAELFAERLAHRHESLAQTRPTMWSSYESDLRR